MTYYEIFLGNKEDELKKAKEDVKDRAATLSDRMAEVSEGRGVLYGVQDLENRLVWIRQAVSEVEKLEKEIKIMKETKEALEFNIGKEITKRLKEEEK
jgi:prefoldin subunit 5